MAIPFKLGIKHSNLFLRWSSACLGYLAAALLFSSELTQSLLSKQQKALGEELTLIATFKDRGEFERILEEVRGLGAATEVSSLSDKQVIELLEPWLGGASSLLQLPQVAAVKVDRQLFSLPKFKAEMAKLTEGSGERVEITDHKSHFSASLGRLEILIRISRLMMAALAIALAFAAFFAVKSSLRSEKTSIEVLAIIGATNRSIALYFALRSGLQVFFGTVAGVALAAATLWLAFFDNSAPDWQALQLWWWATVPFVLAALAMAVGWFSVLKLLK